MFSIMKDMSGHLDQKLIQINYYFNYQWNNIYHMYFVDFFNVYSQKKKIMMNWLNIILNINRYNYIFNNMNINKDGYIIIVKFPQQLNSRKLFLIKTKHKTEVFISKTKIIKK